LQVAVKCDPANIRRELPQIPPTVCVIITKISLKQVFMASDKALPNHSFVGKNVVVHYHVFYNLWF